jgi:predicted DsbA family dithiol-disulfide isomerase
MIIDVWSDVVCPWCFIGKRRLEKALATFEHRDDVIVRHRAFQLQPDAIDVVPTSEHLAEKYRVSPEEVKQMQANVCAVADGEGLCYNLNETLSGNTFDAHRALAYAATVGKQNELLEAMYSAYFEKSLPLFSYEDICKVGETVGIPSKVLLAVLQSDQFQETVIKDRKVASELGATGVPFFVVDMKYGISGAQPLEVFLQTLETAWQERS